MVRCVVTVYMHRYVGSMYFIQSLWDVTYSRSTLLALFVCNTGIVLQVFEARGIHFNKGGKLDLFFFLSTKDAPMVHSSGRIWWPLKRPGVLSASAGAVIKSCSVAKGQLRLLS